MAELSPVTEFSGAHKKPTLNFFAFMGSCTIGEKFVLPRTYI